MDEWDFDWNFDPTLVTLDSEADGGILEYNTEAWVQARFLRMLKPSLRPYAPRIYHTLLMWFTKDSEEFVMWSPAPFRDLMWKEAGALRVLGIAQRLTSDEDVDHLMTLVEGTTEWKRTSE